MVDNIKATDLPPEQHDIAITVFVMAQGTDYGDAVDRARVAIWRALSRSERNYLPIALPLPHRSGVVEDAEAIVVEIMDTGMAARNGYLSVRPTRQAFQA